MAGSPVVRSRHPGATSPSSARGRGSGRASSVARSSRTRSSSRRRYRSRPDRRSRSASRASSRSGPADREARPEPGKSPVTKTVTRRSDGSYAVTFTTAAGVTGAASVTISAKDSRGRMNTHGGAGPGRRLTAPLHSAAMSDDHAAPERIAPVGTGAWVVLPTYNEVENLPGIAAAILEALPGGTLLVVDDSSPDGTGELADRLAADDPRIRVRHRPGKAGPGPGVPRRVRGRARGRRLDRPPDGRRLVARPRGPARRSSRPIDGGPADLVIGSRYTKGGGVEDWGIGRRVISRGGSLFARVVLGLPAARPHRRVQGVARRDAERRCRSTACAPAATCSRSR